ncbi:hypothetical protein IDH50_14690 [Aeromicrobium tamlense]|uniref:Uncharacterized protein n=1 Tax=Aeromicrobium tamlense TaxID=375541 RepID=A0A8I0FTV6_9ACTN|nr:hypothetical protein [Aeromicrobium tamlense]MBD1270377.1 hypothetical protein [Aeromicrobium tamlense]MBD1271491.1 hypothetical protein [Aeromicrobium tamlense]NYI37763.1 hypothetical protein [Aeromicrobium tamlense]
MDRRVRTPDGVGWTVRVGRPALRGHEGDLVVGGTPTGGGFGPLLVVAGLVLLGVLTPVLLKSDRGWVLALVPVLLVAGWLLLARYPVELRRDGSERPLHRTLVAGRLNARRVAGELAEEIERTPDDQLTG